MCRPTLALTTFVAVTANPTSLLSSTTRAMASVPRAAATSLNRPHNGPDDRLRIAAEWPTKPDKPASTDNPLRTTLSFRHPIRLTMSESPSINAARHTPEAARVKRAKRTTPIFTQGARFDEDAAHGDDQTWRAPPRPQHAGVLRIKQCAMGACKRWSSHKLTGASRPHEATGCSQTLHKQATNSPLESCKHALHQSSSQSPVTTETLCRNLYGFQDKPTRSMTEPTTTTTKTTTEPRPTTTRNSWPRAKRACAANAWRRTRSSV